MKYAYSYLRFSSTDQVCGDSVRRQTSLAAAYAEEFGLTLDDQLTYQDFGISSFRGQNVVSGRLGDFLAAVSAGLVPHDSILLVENLDRLSRVSALHAQNLLTQIVLAGVTIVTLADRRIYSIEELRRDPMGLIFALINFIRANEESELKSFRAKANWVAKRTTASTKVLTACCPRWLMLDKKRERFVVIPERAQIVKEIFDLVERGQSFTEISRALNASETPTWQTGKSWTRHSVSSIAKCSAAIGTFVPHHYEWEAGHQVRCPFAPIRNYYPRVVSIEKFERVQARRHEAYRGGQVSIGYMLAQLALCGACKGAVQLIRRGENGPSMVCSTAKAGAGCQYAEIPYRPIESALRKELPAILLDHFNSFDRFGSTHRLRAAQNGVDRARRARPDLNISTSAGGGADVNFEPLRAAEEELQEAVESYQQRSTTVASRKISIALECLDEQQWDGNEALRVNHALKSIFTEACVDTSNGVIDLYRKDGAILQIPFSGFLQSAIN